MTFFASIALAAAQTVAGAGNGGVEDCERIIAQLDELKYDFVDKKSYQACEVDSDCQHSWHGLFCGEVVARNALDDIQRYKESKDYRDLVRRYHENGNCPVTDCPVFDQVVCVANTCRADF